MSYSSDNFSWKRKRNCLGKTYDRNCIIIRPLIAGKRGLHVTLFKTKLQDSTALSVGYKHLETCHERVLKFLSTVIVSEPIGRYLTFEINARHSCYKNGHKNSEFIFVYSQ